MIIPDELMPKDPDTNKPIDIIFNPLGIFGRNNWGVIFETALSKISDDIERQAEIYLETRTAEQAFNIIQRIKMVAELFIKKYDEEYYQSITEQLLPGIISATHHENFDPITKLAEDIVKNGFYIFVPNFPGITYNEFWNDFIKVYSEAFEINVSKSKIKLDENLIKWLREKWQFKSTIFNDIYESEIEAFVGCNYMLKLYHTAFSKYTAVSLANSYSKITGQPTRGRKKNGGQHISWQTLAALLGHKEKNGVLKELYTIKSDAPIKDKEKFLMQYITHGKYKLRPKYVSLTKRAVNNALKILGMRFNKE
jgi:DNA-directed RNA polymerase beta subunit